MTEVDALGGLRLLRAVQSIQTPALDRLFIGVTVLGSEEFFLLVLPVLYWCVDRSLGRQLGRLVLLSAFLNLWLKEVFHAVRPPAGQVRILFGQSASGYAFPSGHAQSAATFWGYLARRVRRRWFSALGGTVALLVALSRLYLGVHWPVDVAFGLAIGFSLAWFWDRARSWWEDDAAAVVAPVRVAAAFAAPWLLLLLNRGPEAVKMVGALSGFSGGAALADAAAPQQRRERWWRLAAKAMLGLAGVFLVRAGLKAVFPSGLVFDGLRYTLVGLWSGFVVPWLFSWVWPVEFEG